MPVEIREINIDPQVCTPPQVRPEVSEQALAQVKQEMEDECLKELQADAAPRAFDR